MKTTSGSAASMAISQNWGGSRMYGNNGRHTPPEDLDLNELRDLDHQQQVETWLLDHDGGENEENEGEPVLLPRAALGQTLAPPDEIIAGILPASKRGIAGMLTA